MILPVLDAAATIETQLQALAAQTYSGGWELVVVDNGSTDDSMARVERWRARLPPVRFVDGSNAPRSVAAARNLGVARARGVLLAGCDADDRVTAGWLKALVRALETADLVGGYLSDQELNPSWCRWDVPWPEDALPRYLGTFEFVSGGNFAVRRAVFDELGGWHHGMSPGEDVDLAIRAARKGFRVRYAPGAAVHYRHRQTGSGIARQQFGYGRARRRLYRRHGRFVAEAGMPRRAARLSGRALRGLLGAPVSRASRIRFLRATCWAAGWAVESVLGPRNP